MKHPVTGIRANHCQAMVGVGGIGAGTFFVLNGNHTLGREESRSGRFLDRRDYCKLHIISHYVQALLGPGFATIPVGKIGNDEVGDRLLTEMKEANLDTRYVARVDGHQTLFSFCFIYPDESGGNLTTDDSACAYVDPAFVAKAEPEFERYAKRGIALAAPEVPLPARDKILDLGSQYGFLRAASFAAEEIPEATKMGMLAKTDLVALNLDEAAAAAGLSAEEDDPEKIAQSAARKLCANNPDLMTVVTAGGRGSWSWEKTCFHHQAAIQTQAVSTAGAGDAFLAGLLVGLVSGLPLAEAQEVANLTAALSVRSPHTINKDVDRRSLKEFAKGMGAPLSGTVWEILEN